MIDVNPPKLYAGTPGVCDVVAPDICQVLRDAQPSYGRPTSPDLQREAAVAILAMTDLITAALQGAEPAGWLVIIRLQAIPAAAIVSICKALEERGYSATSASCHEEDRKTRQWTRAWDELHVSVHR